MVILRDPFVSCCAATNRVTHRSVPFRQLVDEKQVVQAHNMIDCERRIYMISSYGDG